MGTMAAVPADEQVAMTWLRSLSAVPTNKVGTTLPDTDKWVSTGFVQVTAVGGFAEIDVPHYSPVVSIDVWSATENSQKPNLPLAYTIAEGITAACYQLPSYLPQLVSVASTGGFTYVPVVLHSVYPLSRPRRLPDPRSGFAHVTMDFQLHWTMQAFPS